MEHHAGRGVPVARWKREGWLFATTFWGPKVDDSPECGALLREIGVIGTNVTENEEEGMGRHLPAMGMKVAPFLEGQPGVFFLSEEDYFGRALEAFRADRDDPKHRERVPCFNDSAVRDALRRRIGRRARSYDPGDILYFSITNEGGVTHITSPFDFCSCRHCAEAFRDRLKARYGTLSALNEAWETDHAAWSEIEGMTTDQAKARFRGDPDGSLAGWVDFRNFMTWSFQEVLAELRDLVRHLAPGVPVALTGLWPPCVFGGQDWERIAGEYDLLECNDELGEIELVRSLCDERTDLMSTYVARGDQDRWEYEAWYCFIHGYRSFLIDPYSRLIDREKLEVTEVGRRAASWIRPMRETLAPLMADLRRVDDPIWLLHSRASLMRVWVETELTRDEDWAGRPWVYPRTHERYLLNETAWYRVVEDAGRQLRVVSSRVGLPEPDGRARILILPLAVALSDAEVEWIDRFLESGGVVMHDSEIGRFDEMLRPKAAPPDWSGCGPGRLMRLPGPLQDYLKRRLNETESLPECEFFRALADEVLGPPWVRVESAAGGRFEVTTFAGGDERIVAVQRNDRGVSMQQPADDVHRRPVEVTVRFDRPVHVSDVLTEEDLGTTDAVLCALDPIRPIFLHVRQSR